jgi:hypothetical protein
MKQGEYELYERMKREFSHIYDAATIETYTPDSPTYRNK